MKDKINFQKYYDRLDSSIKSQIDEITKDRSHEDKDLVIERIGAENKELTLDNDSPQCVGYISRACTDHSKDFMVPTGCNTAIYELNPIVFFNHQNSGLPVGKCIDIEIVSDGVKTKTEFATDVEFSNDIYKLVKGSFLNTFSIGFLALDYYYRGENEFDGLNTELQSKYPTYDGSADRIITKWLLLEYSIVGIPDNYAAVITSKSIDLTDDTIKVLIPTSKQIDKTVTKVIDRSIKQVIDRTIKVLPKEKEQKIIKLSPTQKAKIEKYYTDTQKGIPLRYSMTDIIDGKA